MHPKKVFALFFLCLAFAMSTSAKADSAADASAFANTLGKESLAIISNTGLSKVDQQAKLEELFQQNVDIDGIGKFVLGRHWKEATEAQQQEYLANYRTFTLKHYTSNLSDFTDTNFEVAKVKPDDNGGQVVTMRIKRPQREDTIIDFDVRLKDGSFKVHDIIIEGVSMITTQRSEFNSVVSQKGLDYLIAQLKQRSVNEDASAQK